MYCGDETGSFIGEIGSHSCRFGYGGEDNPKYVISPYVANKSTMVSSSLSSRVAYNHDNIESIMRMAFTNAAENDQNDINDTDTGTDTDINSIAHGTPITDPNAFLRQGDIVEHWDNLEVAWKTSMEALRVTDTMKHTRGGAPFPFKKHTSTSSVPAPASASASAGNSAMKSNPSSPTSTTLTSIANYNNGTSHTGEGKCVHPILAITSGITQFEGYGADYCAAMRRQQYTRYTETLMESMEASSVFLAPSPMLAAFSLGRQTALVVDVGAGGCRVTPVVDGLILQHSQRRNGRGGDWLGQMALKALLEHHSTAAAATASNSFQKVYPQPRYMLRGLSPTTTNPTTTMTSTPPRMLAKSRVFHQWAMKDLMYELLTEPFIELDEMALPSASSNKKTQLSLSSSQKQQQQQQRRILFSAKKPPPPLSSSAAAATTTINTGLTPTIPGSPTSVSSSSSSSSSSTDTPTEYQLPDGTMIDLRTPFGKDLRRIPELLFADQLPFSGNGGGSNVVKEYKFTNHRTCTDLPIHKLIRESLLSVGDVDARKDLANCICLTGGTSVIDDLDVRLSAEVSAILPTGGFCKPKIVASKSSSVERSYASWIGGSILTSLGSFQQLWLSRTEYEEYGTTMSIQRFP